MQNERIKYKQEFHPIRLFKFISHYSENIKQLNMWTDVIIIIIKRVEPIIKSMKFIFIHNAIVVTGMLMICTCIRRLIMHYCWNCLTIMILLDVLARAKIIDLLKYLYYQVINQDILHPVGKSLLIWGKRVISFMTRHKTSSMQIGQNCIDLFLLGKSRLVTQENKKIKFKNKKKWIGCW